MENKKHSVNALKILSTGDPNTHFHRLSPSDVLKQLGPPQRLLSTSAKVDKCHSLGVLARILYFTPGIFCYASTRACRNACLGHNSGRMSFRTHANARDRRTALYYTSSALFIKRLRAELTLLETDALQLDFIPAARLNGTSDLAWERRHPDLFTEFPDIQFYDYTKLYERMLDFLACTFPVNYHLTYSLDARSTPQAQDILRRGGNVAAIFWPALPKAWWGFPVIDGDLHDARFLDAEGVIVGLRAKGLARIDTEGFTLRPCNACGPEAPELALAAVRDDTHRHTLHVCHSCGYRLKAKWKLPNQSIVADLVTDAAA